jgi:hypothetical protein
MLLKSLNYYQMRRSRIWSTDAEFLRQPIFVNRSLSTDLGRFFFFWVFLCLRTIYFLGDEIFNNFLTTFWQLFCQLFDNFLTTFWQLFDYFLTAFLLLLFFSVNRSWSFLLFSSTDLCRFFFFRVFLCLRTIHFFYQMRRSLVVSSFFEFFFVSGQFTFLFLFPGETKFLTTFWQLFDNFFDNFLTTF